VEWSPLHVVTQPSFPDDQKMNTLWQSLALAHQALKEREGYVQTMVRRRQDDQLIMEGLKMNNDDLNSKVSCIFFSEKKKST
jgi:hypothetical protein